MVGVGMGLRTIGCFDCHKEKEEDDGLATNN
jgi:hypothetical protein